MRKSPIFEAEVMLWVDAFLQNGYQSVDKDGKLDYLKTIWSLVIKNSEDSFKENGPSVRAVMVAIRHFLARILGKTEDRFYLPEAQDPKSYALSKELCEALMGAKAPDVDISKNIDVIWYFDLPRNTIKFHEDSYIRAIFNRGKESLLVLEKSGEPGGAIQTVMTDWHFSEQQLKDSFSPGKERLIEIRDFIKLSHMYFASEDFTGVNLQKNTPDSLREASGKKLKSKIKKHTLFNVIQASAPENNFGRSLDMKRGPLGHKFKVSGHFRWQPHGEKRQKRKLIWIDSHMRGEGEEMNNLKLLSA